MRYALPDGFDLPSYAFVLKRDLETNPFRALHVERGDTVLDVGAFVGTFAVSALEAGGARVVCFEPYARVRAVLERNLARYGSRAEILAEAVAPEDGTAVLEIHGMGGNQSIVRGKYKRCKSEPVQTVSLRKMLQRFRPTVLKMDVEMAEYDILASLERDDLVALRDIFIEFHRVKAHPAEIARICTFLCDAGFTEVESCKTRSTWRRGVGQAVPILAGTDGGGAAGTEMSTTVKAIYKQLETRICKGDLGALLARWEFGRKLLAERGDQKQLPHGFAATLHKNLDMHVQVSLAAYQKELSRRTQFAEKYPTTADVRAAFAQFGSWSEICARGIGKRGASAQAAEGETTEREAYVKEPARVLLSRAAESAEAWHAVVVELQKLAHAGEDEVDARDHIALRVLDVRYLRAMLPLAEQAVALSKEGRERWFHRILGTLRPLWHVTTSADVGMTA